MEEERALTTTDLTPSAEPIPSIGNLEAPGIELLDTPLDFIFAEHFRQRCLCGHLRRIATTRLATREEATVIVSFLTRDLVLHHVDEDEDLFPAVQRRALPEDELEPIVERLTADHTKASAWIDAIRAELTRPLDGDHLQVSAHGADAMLAYATSEHRHLSIENSIVLVIARRRLTTSDLNALSRSMKARRGLIS